MQPLFVFTLFTPFTVSPCYQLLVAADLHSSYQAESERLVSHLSFPVFPLVNNGIPTQAHLPSLYSILRKAPDPT